jgi:hypothetical protein
MRNTISISLFALMLLPAAASGQDAGRALPDAPLAQAAQSPEDLPSSAGTMGPTLAKTTRFGVGSKFEYYMNETYFNPAVVTAPAFRVGLRMANPPGKGATRFPSEWRQGAGAFGRNYGDAIAERTSFQTARFLTGIVAREDPRYLPSSGHNALARSFHALAFSFVDRSDSGHPMPALSNFAGAAAGGFVGNAYLPAGYNDLTHAGQRATIRFGFFAAGNLFREFAPQMPRPVRTFILLIGR